MNDYGPCHQCGETVELKGNQFCLDCLIKQSRGRSYVPLHGTGPRLSGKTGECVTHRRRGCIVCFGEVAE